MEIGKRIRDIRLSKRMTQRKLAELINVTPSFLCRIEKGSSTPSIPLIYSIAKALGVPPQNLLDGVTDYPDRELSLSEQIKITVEKFPVDRQKEVLDILEFLLSRLT